MSVTTLSSEVLDGLRANAITQYSLAEVVETALGSLPVAEFNFIPSTKERRATVLHQWVTDGQKEAEFHNPSRPPGVDFCRCVITEATYAFELTTEPDGKRLGAIVIWPGADPEKVITAIVEALDL